MMVAVGWLWGSTALAAPVGDPVVHRSEGIGSVGITLGGEAIWEQESGCVASTDAACDGVWRRGGSGLVGRLTLIEGVGVDVSVSRLSDRVQQANYRGEGYQGAAGLRAALPLGSGWWLAGVGRYELGRASGGEGEDTEYSRYRQATLSGLLVWDAPTDNGFAAWVGAQGALLWDHHVIPLGEDESGVPILDITMGYALPLASVVGLGITSDTLGPPWGTPWRIALDLDLLIGQSNGVHGQLRLLF